MIRLLSAFVAIGLATAQDDAQVNACAYLAADEVTRIVGVAVDQGERHDDGHVESRKGGEADTYSSTCLWRASSDREANDPSAPLGGARFVILNVMAWPDAAAAGTFLQSFRDAATNHVIPTKPVALEIGDESLWWGDGVAVRKGRISFGISVFAGGPKDVEREQQERLAALIVGRI